MNLDLDAISRRADLPYDVRDPDRALVRSRADVRNLLSEVKRLRAALRESCGDNRRTHLSEQATNLCAAEAEVERLQAQHEDDVSRLMRAGVEVGRLEDALRELVALKDGPRDEDYERRKPAAWANARALLDDRTETT